MHCFLSVEKLSRKHNRLKQIEGNKLAEVLFFIAIADVVEIHPSVRLSFLLTVIRSCINESVSLHDNFHLVK